MASIVYIVGGVIGVVYILTAQRDMLFAKDIGELLNTFGVTNEHLHNLLDGKSVNDFIEDWHGAVEDMTFVDLFGLAGLDETLAPILDDKTLGTVLVKEDGKVTFDIFAFTDDILINEILEIAGVEAQEFYTLFEGIAIADIITRNDEGKIEIGLLDVLLSLLIVNILNLYIDVDEHLHALFDGKSFGTLIKVSDDDISLDVEAFIGDMQFKHIFALAGLENEAVYTIFGDKTIGDWYNFETKQHQWLKFVEDVKLTTVFDIFTEKDTSAVVLYGKGII